MNSNHSHFARLSLCALAFVFAAATHAADGAWKNLLDKNGFDTHWHTTGNWKTDADGAVTLTPRPGESGWSRWSAYLWSKEQYADFQITFDYKVQSHGNSGFYFHVGDKNDPVAKGIEIQIYDSASKKPGAKLTDHDSGGVIPGGPPVKNTAKPAGEWNSFDITCKDGKFVVKLNGEQVNEMSLDHPKIKDRPRSGYIGFQDHGLPLSLRKIRIRRL